MNDDKKEREIVGEKLKDLRNRKQWSMEEAALRAEISASTISNYENGNTSPTYAALTRLLQAYEVSLSSFLSSLLGDRKEDLETFQRYGLGEGVFMELWLSQMLRGRNNVANSINTIFDYPMYAYSLFESLAHFFDVTYHEQIDNLSINLPFDGSKRVLLEPVIYLLGCIFDANHPERKSDMFHSLMQGQAKEQQALQKELYGLSRDRKSKNGS